MQKQPECLRISTASNPSLADYVLEANDTAVAKAANDVVTSGRHNR
jgi:hypothetical protein